MPPAAARYGADIPAPADMKKNMAGPVSGLFHTGNSAHSPRACGALWLDRT
ncbi:hypothetical protein SXCC_04043 [Gluconacetobacter sp. SXCC-1]|nr:hypothetical protein SXCC_04043 [Gluconacetobacter sp. SXCC-1]